MEYLNEIAKQLAGGMSLEQLRQSQQQAAEKPRVKSQQEIEAEQAYWTKVFAERPAKNALFVSRRTAQEMDYEKARRNFWEIMQIRAAQIAMLENNPAFSWKISPQFAETLQNLVKYFINDPSGKLPLTKGLFIFGENGTGKTEVMQALCKFTTEFNLSKQFTLTSMSDVYNMARADKDYDPIQTNQMFDRCFDEFGRNIGPVLRFGDPLDINEAIIEARYSRFRRYGQITHFISNMTGNEAEAHLSPMVFDRLRHLCSSVVFHGKSFRQ